MSLHGSFFQRTFTFRFDARTSRGPMKEKTSWFIKVWRESDASKYGIGECGPLPGLSIDHVPELENVLSIVINRLPSIGELTAENVFEKVNDLVPPDFPSVIFALETALLDLLNGGKKIIFENNFIKGKPIPINGLIWMGDEDFIMKQVHEKVGLGFTCLKLKVGGLDFDAECRILTAIRLKYSARDVTLRLDANGAFSTDDALIKLNALSKFTIHSIEQPIKPNQDAMTKICSESPIPIALDEELIGRENEKHNLLKKILPQYIILKPTLHGGLKQCSEWIKEAERMKINWWITSALESNIGLNAICQFVADYNTSLPQGLGTGALYTNNVSCPIKVDNGFISYDSARNWAIEP